MQEAAACAVLKRRFEAAGFEIVENQMFDEDGIRFEMDGFDPARRVGYEYVTDEAGDGWDVDETVIAALAKRKTQGDLFVLVIREADAPDAKALAAKADAFIAELPKQKEKKKAAAQPPPPPPPPKQKPAAKPAAKKKAKK